METSILTQNRAARIIAAVMAQGVMQAELLSIKQNLKVKPAKTKGPSKSGKNYRMHYNKYYGVTHPHTKENNRRVNQIATGIIPTELVYTYDDLRQIEQNMRETFGGNSIPK